MNQSQIHPALRQQQQNPPQFSSPQKAGDSSSSFNDAAGPQAAYSPLQPSPNHSYQSVQTPQYYSGTVQSPEEHDGSPSGANPSDPNDLKRPRACEACRQLKVKCEFDDSNPAATCKRCAKANRQCIITAPSRKRQKKTDSRVAELEKKIDALTASLVARGGSVSGHESDDLDPAIAQAHMQHQQSHSNPGYGDPQAQSQWPPSRPSVGGPSQSPQQAMQQGAASMKRKLPTDYDYFGGELQKQQTPGFKSQMPVPAFQMFSDRKPSDEIGYVDIIDRKLIDLKTANKCFDRYVSEMCSQLPLVVFPTGTKFEQVRKNKPMLFLAVLAVASGTVRIEIQSRLLSEAMRQIADRVVYRGEKSLELVQMIQVITIFYQPPDRYEELNFNQLIHIAAVMALDIGMGKRSKVGAFAMWKEYMDKKSPLPDSNAAETRRCWLGCYYMCANSAMSLRRPLLIRWGPYSDECLDVLATAPDALPSDKQLCHLVRAQHIAEDIGFQFSMDDPASALSLTDPKTQYHLKAFERQLAEWREGSTKDIMSKPLLKHTDAIINLYMHEIAMHHNHNIDDFKPPYNITPIDGPPDPDFVTPAHIESLTACLGSVHAAFEAFLAMDMKTLRALPTFVFVRNSYAAVALIKMYSAVAAKGSKFGSIFQKEDLKVEQYMDRLIATLTKTAEGGVSKVAYKFSFIFNMLKNWHLKRTEPGVGMSTANTPGAGSMAGQRGLMGTGATPTSRNPGMKDVVGLYKQATTPGPMTTANAMAWNGTAVDPNANASAQRSGLQMLSDAAMVNNNATNGSGGTSQNSSSNTPSTVTLGAPTPQQQQPGWTVMPDMGGPGGVDGSGVMMPTGYNGMGVQGPVEMDNLGFTSDELMAMGNLMEDPGWFSFGLEQGGWAF